MVASFDRDSVVSVVLSVCATEGPTVMILAMFMTEPDGRSDSRVARVARVAPNLPVGDIDAARDF